MKEPIDVFMMGARIHGIFHSSTSPNNAPKEVQIDRTANDHHFRQSELSKMKGENAMIATVVIPKTGALE